MIIELRHVHKTYPAKLEGDASLLHALEDVSLQVAAG